MVRRQPSLPAVWLISDARNDAALERLLGRLPRGSGFVYRHYHLEPAARRQRFDRLARIARRRGHVVVLSGTSREARRWGADGVYTSPTKGTAPPRRRGSHSATEEPPSRLRSPPSRGCGIVHSTLLRLLTAHSLREIGAARRAGAGAILLSPVFPTRSHPGAKTLGPLRFRLLAARAGLPVIALGGMNARRAKRLRVRRWAAIDGLLAADS